MDLVDILEKLHKIEICVAKTSEIVNSIKDEIKSVHKDINGNGKPGIKQDVATICERVTVLETKDTLSAKNVAILIGIITLVVQVGTQFIVHAK